MAKLTIAGVGPGSPDFITPATKKAVKLAELVIGAQRSITLFNDDIKGKTLILTAKNLQDTLRQAAQAIKEGKETTLLSTGDPGYSGLLRTIQGSDLFQEIEVKVIPGVSSIQACAARLNINWDNTCLFSFHDTISEAKKQKLILAFQSGSTILLLPNYKEFTPRDIASLFIKKGADKQTPINICENITLENERITSNTLEGILSQKFSAQCIMVIKQKRDIK
ncbi:MAG: precorrin-6y C5,15-methyltransferase (decarboxylating) subunit CbiE [Crenarchaeota archaeon]|nr:precorrin-6y C5,15-methyltransferase (decarboxylating) subunit CbiE [Thermoproteota archaeon]